MLLSHVQDYLDRFEYARDGRFRRFKVNHELSVGSLDGISTDCRSDRVR